MISTTLANIGKVGLAAGMSVYNLLPAAQIDKGPLDGVTPDINIFGGKINLAILLLLGAVWMLAIMAGVYIMFSGLISAKHAQKVSRDPDKISAGMGGFKLGVWVTALGFAVPIIIGGIIIFVNRVDAAKA